MSTKTMLAIGCWQKDVSQKDVRQNMLAIERKSSWAKICRPYQQKRCQQKVASEKMPAKKIPDKRCQPKDVGEKDIGNK